MLTGYLITKPELGSDVNCSLKSICFSKLLSNLLKAKVSLSHFFDVHLPCGDTLINFS